MNRKPNLIKNKYSNWGYLKYFLAQFIYIIIPAVTHYSMEDDKYIFLFFALFLIYFFFYFFNKKRNQVYSIEFDNDTNIVTVHQFIRLISKEIKIKYEDYSSGFETINFGYSIMKTLVLKDKNKIVAMIGIKNWFGWNINELTFINNYISLYSEEYSSHK